MGGAVKAIVSVVSKVASFGGFNPISFAISIIASSVLSKIFAPNPPKMSGAGAFQEEPNPGQRQQLPPAGDNKLPVVYGSAFLGGMVVDLSISTNNQELYYVIALCEVTNTDANSTGPADDISFGAVYWGGKRVFWNLNGYTVDKLLDESTGQYQAIDGKMEIYLFKNGSNQPTNQTRSAISIMQASNLTYKWDNSKIMTNCAFAIVKLIYSQSRGLTGLAQTRFNVINSRSNPADCIYDYMVSSRYGAAINPANIDTASLDTLRTYSNQVISYTTYTGTTETLVRFRFDGTLDTNQKIMNNLQSMSDCCNCLIRYNEILGQWGVITQTATVTPVMSLNDSNIISAITVSPIDISNSFNIIECKFPDGTQKDSFNSANFDLATIEPSLLYPNEPVNKQSVNLYFVNNNVRAQYIANIMLKAAREDLQVTLEINYVGLQLEAGDIVELTNANYGWVDKQFRITKVTQKFDETGEITAQLLLSEFNSSVYNDVSVTEFTPASNSGIGSPVTFGTIPAPTITITNENAVIPYFILNATTSSSGITQYAEIWYSAYSSPTSAQRIFAGTTEVQSSGDPYDVNTAMPAVTLFNIPSGNWYFFTRMVNSIASSDFSPASAVLNWRPTTFQFEQRYAIIAYADDVNGGGFSLNPRNKLYFGIHNDANLTIPTNPAEYKWYLADPAFSSNVYLTYANRTSRKFSFDTGFANYAAGSGAFVPTQTTIFDPTVWSALQDGNNVIDLDARTGQLISTGTTSVGTGEIGITNTQDGKMVAQLQQFLNFGSGVYTYTGSASTLTIDIYGRVVGFEAPDNFYMTIDTFTATAGQTVFTPTTRATGSAGYITGQDLIFYKGLLLPLADYTENATTVTLGFSCVAGDEVTIISFRSVSSSTGNSYASFTRNDVTLTNNSTYTPSFTLTSGYELLFLNGCIMPDPDYDIVAGSVTNFPSVASGVLSIIQWSANNLSVPNGTPVNIAVNTVNGQTTYNFAYVTDAFNLYNNGVLQLLGTDYNTGTGNYTLTTTPNTNLNILFQQTFARKGAA